MNDEYERGKRLILVGVWQRTIPDEKEALRQFVALKAEITARCKERFLEVVDYIRTREMNVTQAERELKKEPCC